MKNILDSTCIKQPLRFAVRDSNGKVVMESILETKVSTILEFLAGLRGTLSVTFEEGTWAIPYRSKSTAPKMMLLL